MMRTCAWCNEPLGSQIAVGIDDGRVTHGICHSCFEQQMKSLEDGKPAPGALPGAGSGAAGPNSAAPEFLGEQEP